MDKQERTREGEREINKDRQSEETKERDKDKKR